MNYLSIPFKIISYVFNPLLILTILLLVPTTNNLAQETEGQEIYRNDGLSVTGYRLELKKGTRWYPAEVLEKGYLYRIHLRFTNNYRSTNCLRKIPSQVFEIREIELTLINGEFNWKSPGDKSQIKRTLAQDRGIKARKDQWYVIGEFTWTGEGIPVYKPAAALQISTSHKVVAQQNRATFANIFPTRKR